MIIPNLDNLLQKLISMGLLRLLAKVKLKCTQHKVKWLQLQYYKTNLKQQLWNAMIYYLFEKKMRKTHFGWSLLMNFESLTDRFSALIDINHYILHCTKLSRHLITPSLYRYFQNGVSSMIVNTVLILIPLSKLIIYMGKLSDWISYLHIVFNN